MMCTVNKVSALFNEHHWYVVLTKLLIKIDRTMMSNDLAYRVTRVTR